MRAIRHIGTTGVVLLILAALWGATYLSRRGFTREGRAQVETLFAQRGFPVNMRKVILDPVRGMRAQQITFYSDTAREKPVAVLDEMSLDMRYSSFFRPNIALEGWSVDNGEVRFPGNGAEGGGAPGISRLRATALVENDRVALRDVSGKIGGARVTAGAESGDLLVFLREPQILRTMLPEIPWGNLAGFGEELDQIKNMRGSVLRIDLHFSPNPAQEGRWDLRIRIQGGPLVYRNWRVDHIEGELRVQSGQAVLENLVISNETGQMQLTAVRSREDGYWDFDLKSTMNLVRMVRSIRQRAEVPELREADQGVTLQGRWRPRIEGEPGGLNASGHFRMGAFVFRERFFERLDADLSIQEGRLFLRNFICEDQDGKVTGAVEVSPERVGFDLEAVRADRFLELLPGVSQVSGLLRVARADRTSGLPPLRFTGQTDLVRRQLESTIRPIAQSKGVGELLGSGFSISGSGPWERVSWRLNNDLLRPAADQDRKQSEKPSDQE